MNVVDFDIDDVELIKLVGTVVDFDCVKIAVETEITVDKIKLEDIVEVDCIAELDRDSAEFNGVEVVDIEIDDAVGFIEEIYVAVELFDVEVNVGIVEIDEEIIIVELEE